VTVNRNIHILVILIATFFTVFPTPVQADPTPNACITCHKLLGGTAGRAFAEWNNSIHQENGVTCESCHGGNAEVDLTDIGQLTREEFAARTASAMSPTHGFVGKPAGTALFDMCRMCHSGAVERFQASIMGKAYIGKKGGPSCVTCHQAHNNEIPEIPKVCKNCHKDTTGFDRIDPMSVNEATISRLSGVRIKLAEEKAIGNEPPLLPEFPEELGSFRIGFVAFGAVVVLFVVGHVLLTILEKRK
jgi:hypothetical protein